MNHVFTPNNLGLIGLMLCRTKNIKEAIILLRVISIFLGKFFVNFSTENSDFLVFFFLVLIQLIFLFLKKSINFLAIFSIAKLKNKKPCCEVIDNLTM